MKNAVVCLFLLELLAPGQSQVIQLDEAKLKFVPQAMKVNNGSSLLQMNITESYSGHFHENPVKFGKENFVIGDIIKASKGAKYDSYYVTFRNKMGIWKCYTISMASLYKLLSGLKI